MRSSRREWLGVLAIAVTLLACGAPMPTRSPTSTPEETATPRPIAASPSADPAPIIDPNLHIDGMATVLADGLKQVVDPAHPNHNRRQNEQLGTLAAGDRVYLSNLVRSRGDSYWQVSKLPGTIGIGLIGWIAEHDGETPNIEPYGPVCPTTFPLSAADLVSLGALTALACFADTEQTLSGTVKCSRGVADGVIGGAAFLDSNRLCYLDDQYPLLGQSVTSLLDEPDVIETVTGNFLVRGHFDDPEAQTCTTIAFGSSLNSATRPPEPGPVMSCRQLFVVGSVTSRD